MNFKKGNVCFLRSQLCVFPFLKFFNRKVKTLFCKKQIFLLKKMTHTFFTNFLLKLLFLVILAKNINHSLILDHYEKETITNFCHFARLCRFR